MGTGSAAEDLDQVVEQYHAALGEFMKGSHEPAQRLFSDRDDVTLGNPFGPFARGFVQVTDTMRRAAAHYRGKACRRRTAISFPTNSAGSGRSTGNRSAPGDFW